MEYVFLGLLILIVILLIILLLKKQDNSRIFDKISRTEVSIVKEIGEFKHDFSSDLNKDFNNLNDRIENKLNLINQKVNEKLEDGFDKTNKTFNEVMNRLTRIDEAQKKIDGLGNEIISLEGILTDKKSRGIFGEVNLYHILSSIFGEKNDKIYKTQYTLSNGSIADSIIFGPEPLGTICIDSKFPLENYRRLVEKGLRESEREARSKLFENDVKKHIDAIASKYIISGETSDQAIMFLPAEAIFAEINAYHTSLIKYALSHKVWITSPTTLMSLLTIIQSVLMGLERDKYTSVIHEELNKLGLEFGRYKERWDKLSRSIQTVNNDVENIHKTTEKITKRFDSISNVKIEDKYEDIEYAYAYIKFANGFEKTVVMSKKDIDSIKKVSPSANTTFSPWTSMPIKMVKTKIVKELAKELLIEPKWLLKKVNLLNDIDKEMVKRNTYQGIKYNKITQ